MKHPSMSDDEILRGFREGDDHITRDYFYGYCQIAYAIHDHRYQLRNKPGLDFHTLAHRYYLDLVLHDWVQLEDRSDRVSLKTWMVKGFLFVVLEAMRDYQRETKRSVDWGELFEQKAAHTVDIGSNTQQFNEAIEDICHEELNEQEPDCTILRMILIQGYKGKEVAQRLHITPSAVSQRYRRMRDHIVLPYLKEHLYA